LELGSAREWIEGRTESGQEGRRHDRSQRAELDVGKIEFKVSVNGSPEEAAKTWLTCVHHWRPIRRAGHLLDIRWNKPDHRRAVGGFILAVPCRKRLCQGWNFDEMPSSRRHCHGVIECERREKTRQMRTVAQTKPALFSQPLLSLSSVSFQILETQRTTIQEPGSGIQS
jgi:hypothetical protein